MSFSREAPALAGLSWSGSGATVQAAALPPMTEATGRFEISRSGQGVRLRPRTRRRV
jgi:hypothetical protein